jgi:peptidoglycan hydrolase CwlO-like protein
LEADLDAERTDKENIIAKRDQEYDRLNKVIEDLESQIANLGADSSETLKKLREELEKMKELHKSTIEELKSQHKGMIDNINTNHEKEMTELEERLRLELND